MRDYYATLQVDPRADVEVIEAAYRRLARKWHPDANADPGAAARMQELNAAYEVLRDPERRRAYDAARPTAGGTARADLRSWRTAPTVVAVLGLLGLFLGVRLLGGLARLPILLALFGAGVYWLVRSLERQQARSRESGRRAR